MHGPSSTTAPPTARTTRGPSSVAYHAATGSKLWSKRYDGPASTYDVGYALSVAPNGEAVYVTGRCGNDLASKSKDYATIAYSTA